MKIISIGSMCQRGLNKLNLDLDFWGNNHSPILTYYWSLASASSDTLMAILQPLPFALLSFLSQKLTLFVQSFRNVLSQMQSLNHPTQRIGPWDCPSVHYSAAQKGFLLFRRPLNPFSKHKRVLFTHSWTAL